jgi:hypothetical protein
MFSAAVPLNREGWRSAVPGLVQGATTLTGGEQRVTPYQMKGGVARG